MRRAAGSADATARRFATSASDSAPCSVVSPVDLIARRKIGVAEMRGGGMYMQQNLKQFCIDVLNRARSAGLLEPANIVKKYRYTTCTMCFKFVAKETREEGRAFASTLFSSNICKT